MQYEWHGHCDQHAWAVRRLPTRLDRDRLRRALADRPNGLLLESIMPHQPYGRYSYYANGTTSLVVDQSVPTVDPLLSKPFIARPAAIPLAAPAPFVGGWIGFLGYEFGGFTEPIRRRHTGMHGIPLARWWQVDSVLAYDSQIDAWYASGCGEDAHAAAQARERAEQLATLNPAVMPAAAQAPVNITSNRSRESYMDSVRRALEYIHAGDVYQVNLAQRFSMPFHTDIGAHYAALCHANPATYAACLSWVNGADPGAPADTAVVSSSPELFVHVLGRHIITRPIKGTRRRTGDPRIDDLARQELEQSAKDAAELVMIVDLERNDLGRLCEYGSVQVIQEAQTEAHPTVFHRVATVSGTLREDATLGDILRATFPGGSITGAPKVRAMQLIDELEPDPRGPYCGAIGYVGIDGSMMLNLAIRTMCVVDGTLYWWSGGGIVADSDPASEYDESLAKAEGMRRACMPVGKSNQP